MISARQVRRPLIGIALSMSAGLSLYACTGGAPLGLLGAAALLLAAVCRWSSSSFSTPLIYLLCGLLAASYSAIQSMPSFSRTVLMTAEVSCDEQEFIGKISDEPPVPDEDGTGKFLFYATAVRLGAEWLPVDTVMRVYLKDRDAGVRFGERWRLKGRYTGYGKSRSGIAGFLSVPDGGAVRMKPAQGSLMRRCHQIRGKAAEILRAGIEPFRSHFQLLHALLLGYRQSIPPDLYQLCARAGVLHIFAISGLHVVVMASILIAGLKFIGVTRPRWGWVLIPALFLYVVSTGMRPSALRAFTMSAVYFAAPLAGRRPDTSSAIALAAILLLILNPANIGDPGFMLSFVVVCGLVMVHGWAVRQWIALRSSRWEQHLTRLNGHRPLFALVRNMGGLMLTSLSAWLFSTPITAMFFYTISAAALIANLLVVPLTSMIMFGGCLALLSGTVCLPAAALFNQANWVFINVLIWIVGFFSALPGGYRAVGMPSAGAIGLWYTGLVLFFAGPVRWRKGAILMVLLSVLVWRTDRLVPCRDIRIIRDTDSAMLLRFPGTGWELVTDGSDFHVGRAIRLAQKEGVNRLHTLVVSGTRADPNVIQRLQETFHPQATRFLCDESLTWTVDGGVVRILAAPSKIKK